MDFDQEHSSEDSSNDEISYHGEDDDDDQMSSDDDIDEDDTIIVGQRVHLEGDDKDRIAQLLPVGPYVGILFVTRLTTTNLRRYDMVSIIYINCSDSFPFSNNPITMKKLHVRNLCAETT